MSDTNGTPVETTTTKLDIKSKDGKAKAKKLFEDWKAAEHAIEVFEKSGEALRAKRAACVQAIAEALGSGPFLFEGKEVSAVQVGRTKVWAMRGKGVKETQSIG